MNNLFERVKSVGFDLDNTLYPINEEIENRIRVRFAEVALEKRPDLKSVEVAREFFENEEDMKKRLENIKRIAINIKDSLLTRNIDSIGRLLHESWEIKKKVGKEISISKIDELYEIGIKNGATGGKLLGAGGGGYLLFFHDPKKRSQLET